jgi:hypothetical protein
MVARRLVLLAVAGTLIGGACSSSSSGYSEDTAGAFTKACVVNDAQPVDFCRCVYDQITQHVPFDRYVENDKKMQADKDFVPDEYLPFVADCGSRATGSGSSASS